MFEQRTIIDQIEITRDGEVRLRLDKQLLRDGKVISEPKYHRVAWEPGADFESSISIVNSHLVQMDEAIVEPEEWDRVREVITQQHTQKRIDDWREKHKTIVAALEEVSSLELKESENGHRAKDSGNLAG